MFDLHPEEKVIIYIRKHWIFLFIEVKLIALLFIFPALLIWLFQYFGYVPDINLFGVSVYSFSDILVYLWGIFCWLLLAERFTNYALNFWILTNKRILESEFLKLFDRRLSTLELEDIEDVTIEIRGFWRTIFGFGKLEVQTAGTEREFIADNILYPTKVQQEIFEAKLRLKEEDKDLIKDDLFKISEQAYENKFAFPKEQEYIKEEKKEVNNFDWANLNEKQKSDLRNITEEIEDIDAKFKKDIDQATRTE